MGDQNVPEWYKNPFHGYRTTRFYNLLNEGEVWQRLCTHPSILPVARAVLGEDCLLNTYLTSIIGPGETTQPIHVDDGAFIGAKKSGLKRRPHLPNGGPRESIVFSGVVALSDFTAENGATRIVPKSHLL